MTVSLLEQQVKLEREIINRGILRYKASQDGQALADTDGGTLMIQQSLDRLTKVLEEKYKSATRGRNVRALSVLTQHDDKGVRQPCISADKAMYIALKVTLAINDSDSSITNVASNIAARIEDEIRFSEFEGKYEAYYSTIQAGFRKRGSVNYRYKHRALTHAANSVDNVGDDWVSWIDTDKILVGTYLLDIILLNTNFIETYKVRQRGNKGYQLCIKITQHTIDQLYKIDSFRELLRPSFVPMIIPPKDWTSATEGGYYTPAVATRFPFIKSSWKSDQRAASDIVNTGVADRMLKAVNMIQKTPWKINTDVYDNLIKVFEGGHGVGLPDINPVDIPVWSGDSELAIIDMTEAELASFTEWKREATVAHTLERERHNACRTFLRTLDLAKDYKGYDNIYFPHNCDFRGRIYCASTGLSPQGDDIGKALLTFSNAERITPRGAYWLAVHGANTYGEDKLDFDGREQWVINNTEAIRECAIDPIRHRSFWGNADKPWQFLAFCFEWLGYTTNKFEHETRLPVALDGSCNGLQHYSALFRDEVGASATNLNSTKRPSDIYQQVATVCTAKIKAAMSEPEPTDGIRFWASISLDRKLAKKPVMTLPYGSTRLTCADSIQDWLKDKNLGTDAFGRQQLAWALTPLLWDSIGEVVVAARAGMDWLQEVSREQSRTNTPLVWSTPLGFPIIQKAMRMHSIRVRTQLMGATFRPKLDTPTSDLCPRKQASGIAPNFTHGNDAAHLGMTVLENGDCDYAMVHDSYGCHANGIDKLHESIRKAFYNLYANNDIIQNFIDDTETEIEPPKRGEYSLEEINDATYFFG